MENIELGALPDYKIRELIAKGYIGTDIENVKPSSIDLTLDEERYSLPSLFTVPAHSSVRELIKKHNFKKASAKKPIKVGEIQLIKIKDRLDLRSDMYAYANPKSTTGRTDLHARLLADKVILFDSVQPKGYSGELWTVVKPNSF